MQHLHAYHINCFTRWPEAVPINDASATTIANVLLSRWIANYGVPETITSDKNCIISTISPKSSAVLTIHAGFEPEAHNKDLLDPTS